MNTVSLVAVAVVQNLISRVDVDLNVYLQVILDIVHADITPTEEQNVTETAKTYKVNCDKRNITEMDKFTVQVLNSSQVFMLLCSLLVGVSDTP